MDTPSCRDTKTHLKMNETDEDSDGFHEIKGRTRGCPAVFSIKLKARRIKKKCSRVTSYVIRRAQIAASMSGKQVIKFLCHMKYAVGREVFLPRIREDLIETCLLLCTGCFTVTDLKKLNISQHLIFIECCMIVPRRAN